ncbi:hypothetical protein AURDEDRAFT_49930 [Auricularia subglabra TFB-10046 SS5]|nr:hypothetical protein AURDEDRAFT_49930 [Auricularia subglabra TFB-10046 SS5]
MSKQSQSTSRTPKGWPHSIEYITQPRYAAHVPVAIKKHLQGDGRSVPAAPCLLVQIRRITTQAHPAHGQAGLFATRKIAANTFILDYMGEIHTDVRETSDYDLSLVRLPAAEFAVGEGDWLSAGVDAARCGNEARFVNDYRGVAPRANAVFKEGRTGGGELRIGVWSGSRGIDKNEEIVVSYGKGWWSART